MNVPSDSVAEITVVVVGGMLVTLVAIVVAVRVLKRSRRSKDVSARRRR